jgi:hypothetical protein
LPKSFNQHSTDWFQNFAHDKIIRQDWHIKRGKKKVL